MFHLHVGAWLKGLKDTDKVVPYRLLSLRRPYFFVLSLSASYSLSPTLRIGEISLKWYKVTSERLTHTHAHTNSDSSRLSGPCRAARRHQSQDPYTHTSPVKHTHPNTQGLPAAHEHTQTGTHALTHARWRRRVHTHSEQEFNWKCWRLKNFSFISQCCNWIWGTHVCVWSERARRCVRVRARSADSGVSIDSKSKNRNVCFSLCEDPSHPSIPDYLTPLMRLFNSNSNSSTFQAPHYFPQTDDLVVQALRWKETMTSISTQRHSLAKMRVIGGNFHSLSFTL